MTVVLDSGGVSALATQPRRLAEMRRRGQWPPRVPSIVLAECLTGDHRTDFHANRLLRTCQVRDVDEITARAAARLRTATRRAGAISAVDAVVAAFADVVPAPIVLTSDPGDLTSLADHTLQRLRVVAV